MIDRPSLSLHEAELSRHALTLRRRGVSVVLYSDLSSGEETSRTRSAVLRGHRYRDETSERSGTPTHSSSFRSPAETEERASRDRQITLTLVPPPVFTAAPRERAMSVTGLGIFVATVLKGQSHVLLALPLAVKREQMQSV